MFAGVILTPRTIIDKLADPILKDLINITSIKVVWKKYWQIKPSEVHIIYPKLKNRLFCDNLTRNLTLGKSLVLLVSGKNIYYNLRKAKGEFQLIDHKKPKISGLRLKYRASDNIINKKINHSDNDLFFEYRLHSTDSLETTINLMALCANNKDMKKLYRITPELYSKIKAKKCQRLI